MVRMAREWTSVADEVAGTQGTGIVFAPAEEAGRVVADLERSGWRVVAVAGAGVADFRAMQARIAEALGLPSTAGRNLDALADSLRDIGSLGDKVALAWSDADVLVDADLPGWFRLTDVLEGATADLWRDGGPGDALFETVLLVRGLGGTA